jgi:hypothetical protein
MQAAYKQCGKFKNDHVCLLLKDYYGKHIVEEMNHDQWILDDLKVIGIPNDQIISRKPSQIVAELVGGQYYWIYHWHPISLLGYIAVMEGYPPKREQIDYLKRLTGFPETAFQTIAKHSYLDPDHKEDLDNFLNQLPLTNNQQEWISLNALSTAKKLREIFSTI